MNNQQLDQRERRNALATALATDALKLLDAGLTVSTTLSTDHPETLHNFEQFKTVLMMAYTRGAFDAHAGRVVLAASDISAFKDVGPESVNAVLANTNIRIFNPT